MIERGNYSRTSNGRYHMDKKKKMDETMNVRLPRLMGPVEHWQGKCKPIDTHPDLSEKELNEDQKNILNWIRDFYDGYTFEEHMARNSMDEPVVVLNCDFPRYEAYSSSAFNLDQMEKKLEEEGEQKVRSYLRIPEPYHWQTNRGMHPENQGEQEQQSDE